ncbi:MAG: phosphohistidine phosphatase SixA [Pseudomonadota bacterium]
MELILWRHAEAENSTPDAARKLTDRGVKQAKKMSDWLRARLPQNTRIIASPTQRTQQTAQAFSHECEIVDRIGPGAHIDDILAAANWPNAQGAVVVVGHQPTLGEVADYLITNIPAGLSFKKGAVWWISYRMKAGVGESVLHTVIYPDML